jgi:tRNA(fMet)-specific endonuclease VapC
MFAGSARSRIRSVRAPGKTSFCPFCWLTFDDAAAGMGYSAALEAAGTPIGPYDMQIAAIALVHNLIVVTHNVREFGRIEGLQIEDWEL